MDQLKMYWRAQQDGKSGKEHPQQGFQGPLHRGWDGGTQGGQGGHRGWDGPQTQPRVSNYWGLWQQATSACLLPPHTSCLDLCCVSLLVQFALDSGIVSPLVDLWHPTPPVEGRLPGNRTQFRLTFIHSPAKEISDTGLC